MSREKRKELIAEIEAKRGTRVIAYVTSDRPGLSCPIAGDVVPIVHNHIMQLRSDSREKFDLFLYSRGGHSDVPWAIVSMFRECSQKGSFSVLIPFRAHSAATVIAMGADEIVMTEKAELGPIDITIPNGPYNPIRDQGGSVRQLPISVEDVMGYFSLMKKAGCDVPSDRMKAFELLSQQVHPLALGSVSRLLDETKLVARRLLETRSKSYDSEHTDQVIQRLSSQVYSHAHAISRSEARDFIGLDHVVDAESVEIRQQMWALYENYRDLFSLEKPFNPEEELALAGEDERTWTGLPLAYVESVDRCDVLQYNLRVRKLRQVPPNVNVSLGQINLPTIQIQQMPANLTGQALEEWVKEVVTATLQQTLQQAADAAAKALLAGLPAANFERFQYGYGWVEEVNGEA